MFVKATEDQPQSWYPQRAIEMVNAQLRPFEAEIKEIRFVRHVAGRKHMYCVTFELSRKCLTSAKSEEASENAASAVKRSKYDDDE